MRKKKTRRTVNSDRIPAAHICAHAHAHRVKPRRGAGAAGARVTRGARGRLGGRRWRAPRQLEFEIVAEGAPAHVRAARRRVAVSALAVRAAQAVKAVEEMEAAPQRARRAPHRRISGRAPVIFQRERRRRAEGARAPLSPAGRAGRAGSTHRVSLLACVLYYSDLVWLPTTTSSADSLSRTGFAPCRQQESDAEHA